MPDVPRGRGGAETAGPEPTPPPARARPAGGLQSRNPASEAQRATPAPARRRSPCFRPRSASPISYLPRAPTPPLRPGCEVLVLSSVEALGLLCPTRVGCSCPRRPGRRPRPVPDKPCSYWFLFPPLTLGPAPGATRSGGEPPPLRTRYPPEPCPGVWCRDAAAAAAGDRRHCRPAEACKPKFHDPRRVWRPNGPTAMDLNFT